MGQSVDPSVGPSSTKSAKTQTFEGGNLTGGGGALYESLKGVGKRGE